MSEEMSLYGAISALNEIESGFENELDIEKITTLIKTKTDNVFYYNQSLLDKIKLINERITELENLREKTERKQKRLCDYVLTCLNTAGIGSINGNIYSIKKQAGRERVEVYDEKMLPVEFIRVTTKESPDKTKIKKAIDDGEVVQGARVAVGEETIVFKGN